MTLRSCSSYWMSYVYIDSKCYYYRVRTISNAFCMIYEWIKCYLYTKSFWNHSSIHLSYMEWNSYRYTSNYNNLYYECSMSNWTQWNNMFYNSYRYPASRSSWMYIDRKSKPRSTKSGCFCGMEC